MGIVGDYVGNYYRGSTSSFPTKQQGDLLAFCPADVSYNGWVVSKTNGDQKGTFKRSTYYRGTGRCLGQCPDGIRMKPLTS